MFDVNLSDLNSDSYAFDFNFPALSADDLLASRKALHREKIVYGLAYRAAETAYHSYVQTDREVYYIGEGAIICDSSPYEHRNYDLDALAVRLENAGFRILERAIYPLSGSDGGSAIALIVDAQVENIESIWSYWIVSESETQNPFNQVDLDQDGQAVLRHAQHIGIGRKSGTPTLATA